MKVYVDPRNLYLYSTYYYLGIKQAINTHLIFSSTYFISLNRDAAAIDKYMAFIVEDKGKQVKVIVDFSDNNIISNTAYAWCDVYAKINIDINCNIKEYSKLLSITPGFGIRDVSYFQILVRCFSNLVKCKFKPLIGINRYMRDYLYVFKLSKLSQYVNPTKLQIADNYVYNISTLWPNPNCINTTNKLRAIFMRCCINNPHINFEGGFYCTNQQFYDEYGDLFFDKRVSPKVYLSKTKKSSFVFNTPSVHNCHGWKLGEFLAMGKAIITTPISNHLPVSLQNGENYIEVHDSKEINEAIAMLLSNRLLRNQIAGNNKKYFEKYASPSAVIKQILLFSRLRQEAK